MSIETVLADRYALWTDELYDWGYVIEKHPRSEPPNGILIRARRPDMYGDPPLVLDIAEIWDQGADPDGLRITDRGCFLATASWHAQFPRSGELGAERLDVDRSKPRELIVHRHPLGQPNDVREKARWQRPESWLQQVGRLVVAYNLDESD